ncbi:hypothetical protein [Lentibacillus salinarum]|uniref:TIR domain-containing protein n=1 Tax=Lentibacillus salinarum TaxID=446820 RepID=A0ABW3ZS82_9BACI
MKSIVLYYQEQSDLNTTSAVTKMKSDLKKEKGDDCTIYVDKQNVYEKLMYLITEELNSIDVVYIYSRNNIRDDFYWDLLVQSAKADNVVIMVYT